MIFVFCGVPPSSSFLVSLVLSLFSSSYTSNVKSCYPNGCLYVPLSVLKPALKLLGVAPSWSAKMVCRCRFGTFYSLGEEMTGIPAYPESAADCALKRRIPAILLILVFKFSSSSSSFVTSQICSCGVQVVPLDVMLPLCLWKNPRRLCVVAEVTPPPLPVVEF